MPTEELGCSHKKLDLDDFAEGCHAVVSTAPVINTAVVFVHGFDGDPVATWKDFPGVMDKEPHSSKWATCDTFFFNYRSVSASIDDSSDMLREFLEAVFPIPTRWLQSRINRGERPNPTTYSDLILVGHSEGGVVIRAAIAEFGKRLRQMQVFSPILNARVALFAPALFGFLPTGWLGLISQFAPLRNIKQYVIAGSRAAAELEDGVALAQIRRDNEQLYREYPEYAAFSAHVVFGELESVVRKHRYFQDIKYKAVPGKDHRTLCKPNSAYPWPLKFVRGS